MTGSFISAELDKAEWLQEVDAAVKTVLPALQLQIAAISSVPSAPPASGDVFSVKSFPGVVGDGVNDDTLGLQAARDFIAAQANPPRLVFPAGEYRYSQSPNWAIPNAVIDADGEVHLHCTGSGPAVLLDAGAGEVYNVTFGRMGRFIIETEVGNGIYLRSVHHSKIRARVAGCGIDKAAFLAEFSVCSDFDIVVSVNEGGWYQGKKPYIGYDLGQRGAGETVSYCTFTNAIVEGPQIGIQLSATLGNVFTGGTSEGCSLYGVYAKPLASGDKFFGMDFELNGAADIYCFGRAIKFIECDSYTTAIIGAGAKLCAIRGGEYSNILLDSGSTHCHVQDVIFNRFNNGSKLLKHANSIEPVVSYCRNGGSGAMW